VKAIVKTAPGPGNLAYQDFPDPEVRPGEVVIEVKAAGICGTDLSLHAWAGSMVREYRPEPPLVMGHELAGTVAAVGPGAEGLGIGTRVIANPIMYCGRCYHCRAGRPSICDDRPMLGVRLHGCFARFVAVRRENVFPLPPGVPFETGALAEVLCVGLHALDRVPVTAGDTVVVVGPGPLGAVMLLAARAAGASRVVVVGLESDRERLGLVASLGAVTITADREDPAAALRELTRGLGADVVFECAGHPSAIVLALGLVRKGGRIGVLGQGYADAAFNPAVLSYRELELVGVRSYDPRVWHRSHDVLASGQMPLERLVTHRLPLEEAVRGIELMKTRAGLKILFTPSWA
jgi:2-desacetyl-2-hydroxyethyl bacteriochlorophyllide A dehydrogenase